MIVDATAAAPTGPIVTIVLDGQVLAASEPARLMRGLTMAPIVPFVDAIAERVEVACDGTQLHITRGTRAVTIRLVGVRPSNIVDVLPSDAMRIPLAPVVRALGGDVAYDARSHTLAIDLVPEPVTTLAPAPFESPRTTPAPLSVTTPRPASGATHAPHPRRTPILIVEPPRS